MALYQTFDKKWWRGRIDGTNRSDLRWHQVVKGLNYDATGQSGAAILGFSCDEGVRRNEGRTGAAAGPEQIQRAMCNFPYRVDLPIYDAGNVLCDNEDLEAAQKLLGIKVAEILGTGCIPIVLGGGHEIAWGHFQGLVKSHPDANIGIINFDAHFDLRQADQGNSGTPFRQIADFQALRNGAFNYLALGIQKHSNTETLFAAADELGVDYYFDTDFNRLKLPMLEEAIYDFIEKLDLVYLTIDVDCFHTAYAPGVSAVNIQGIHPDEITITLLKAIVNSGKLVSVDVAEVNPKYDIDKRTARLAAYLVYQIIEELDRLKS